MAGPRTGTMSSWVGMAATAPMSGSTRASANFGRRGEEGNLAALHPTVKPVALIADALLDCSARGDLVLDPFLGSGSTVIAAERVGRSCHAMELDPLYVDAAIRRWQQFTGDSAVHTASGNRFDGLVLEGGHGQAG